MYTYIVDNLPVGHTNRPAQHNSLCYITIHSTANQKSTAKQERAYLERRKDYASFHYVIDDKNVIQCIPDDFCAYHAGDANGNALSLGIEICESGDRKTTLENAAQFTAKKLKEYNFSITNIKKHYDWTRKNCPRILIDTRYIVNGMDWNYFIERVGYYMLEKQPETRYNTLEEMPEYYRTTVQKLIMAGALAGNGNGFNLSEDMLRVLTIIDRYILYNSLER